MEKGIGDIHSEERGTAARFNAGKPTLELIPMIGLIDAARVFDYGRQKYAEWNWAKGMPWSAVLGSLLRHLEALQRGEEYDPESGLPHIGHVMCNALMLATYRYTYPSGNDLPAKFLCKNDAQDAE